MWYIPSKLLVLIYNSILSFLSNIVANVYVNMFQEYENYSIFVRSRCADRYAIDDVSGAAISTVD